MIPRRAAPLVMAAALASIPVAALVSIPVAITSPAPVALASPGPSPGATVTPPTRVVPDTLGGRVILGPDSVPLAGAAVALHRITTDSAGVVDSVTSDAEGRFSFGIDREPRGEAVYLASTRYSGIVYLGAPIHGGELPENYRIHAFETLPMARSDTLPVAIRQIVLMSEGSDVVARDLIDLGNPTSRTLVPAAGSGPLWRLALPAGIGDARVLAGGEAFADIGIEGERIAVGGHVAPGGRRLPVSYRLPTSGPWEWRFLHPTERVELHVPGEGPPMEVAGLEPRGTSSIGGTPYRRYAGDGFVPGDVVSVTTGGGGDASVAWAFMGLGVVFGAAALLTARSRRRARDPA